MQDKITRLLERFNEIETSLGMPEVFEDQKLYRELTQEHAYLSELKETWLHYQKIDTQLIENKELLLSEQDPELINIIKEEIESLENEKIIIESNNSSVLNCEVSR